MRRILVNQWFALKDAGIPLVLPEPEFANRAVGGIVEKRRTFGCIPASRCKARLAFVPQPALSGIERTPISGCEFHGRDPSDLQEHSSPVQNRHHDPAQKDVGE